MRSAEHWYGRVQADRPCPTVSRSHAARRSSHGAGEKCLLSEFLRIARTPPSLFADRLLQRFLCVMSPDLPLSCASCCLCCLLRPAPYKTCTIRIWPANIFWGNRRYRQDRLYALSHPFASALSMAGYGPLRSIRSIPAGQESCRDTKVLFAVLLGGRREESADRGKRDGHLSSTQVDSAREPGYISPSSRARATASVRLWTCSLLKIFRLCPFTVSRARNSRSLTS